MKKIKIKDKELLKELDFTLGKLHAAESGLAVLSGHIRQANELLFKTLYEHVPETKGYHIRYNSAKNTVSLVCKLDDK